MTWVVGEIANDLRLKARWSYGTDRGLGTVLRVLLTDGSMAIVLYRWMQWARRYHITPLEFLANRLNGIFCNCYIGRGAEFGSGFVLLHADGVVINRLVRGGNNIYIEHQVTIGADRGISPQLGDNIFIGAGAKILGSITIGNGARVGANAVVLRDVPAHATVAGVPAKVVRQRQPGDEDTLLRLGSTEQWDNDQVSS